MASDGEYVRWVNSKEPGKLMFVTTTILGYTSALTNDSEKSQVLELLVEACRHHGLYFTPRLSPGLSEKPV